MPDAPTTIVLLRHGQSVGNIIDDEIKLGNFSHCTPELISIGEPKWPLSELGQQQSILSGQYLHEHFPNGFDTVLCSSHTRAKETLAALDFGAGTIEPLLREQSLGELVGNSMLESVEARIEFEKAYPYDINLRPPGGETLFDVYLRMVMFWQKILPLQRGRTILLVTHWGPIFLSRLILSGIPLIDFYEANTLKRKVLNCQMDFYTDCHPITGAISPPLSWNKSICIHGIDRTSYPWQKM